jgi:hypothetical protein
MGSVHLGRAADGSLAAVKVVRPELARDPVFVARFAREVEAARRVAGFCTARPLDAGPGDDPPWLATEYVDGPSLDEAIRRDGPLDAGRLDALAAGTATALAAIHAAGLVHRDLKPANVLLAESGPRVIDFGIARALDSATLTGTGVLVGTPGWMAPEQLTGGPETPATDVFAWGGLVAFAATGRPPFGTGRVEALTYRIVHGRPDLDGLPAHLRVLAARAMARDPAERPSARDLLLDLVGQAGAGPAPAVRPSAGIPAAPVAPTVTEPRVHTLVEPARRRVALLAGLPALVVLLLAWALLGGRGGRPPQAAPGTTAAAPATVAPVTAPASTTSGMPSGTPAEATVGTAVADGDLRVVVAGVTCSRQVRGLRPAGDRFCLGRIEATNTGARGLVLSGARQLLVDDAGRRRPASRAAMLRLPEGGVALPLPPGATGNATLAWDLPAGVRPVAIELHASAGSRGATVAVPAL